MGAMWFCPALLIVSFLSFGMMKITEKKKSYTRHLVFVVAMTIGAVCSHLHVKSPYCLWQYLQICMIFYMGFTFRKFEWLFKNAWIKLCSVVMAMAVLFFSTRYNFLAHLQPNNISEESAFAIMLIALVGSIGVYSISSLLAKQNIGKILAVVGDHSFSIMALHFLAFKIVILIQCLVCVQNLSNLYSFPCFTTSNYWWIAYTFVGVSLPIMVSKYSHSFINKLTGKNN